MKLSCACLVVENLFPRNIDKCQLNIVGISQNSDYTKVDYDYRFTLNIKIFYIYALYR